MKRQLHSLGVNPESLFGRILAGGASGAANALVMTPIELIKIRLQVQSHGSQAGQPYRGPIDCTRRIVRDDGLRGLYR